MNKALLILILIILIILLCYNNKHKYENFKVYNKIDKIYVINLKKNQDRLEKFMENAKKANVEVERFDAVYGKELKKDHPDIFKYFGKYPNIHSGEIGCALSHIKIWEDAIKNNYNNIIVFEDDAIIPKDFWDRFDKAYNELPEDWEMLLIGCCTCTGNTTNKTKLIKANSTGNWCLSGYLIQNNYCKKLIDRIYKNKIEKSIDEYTRMFYSNDNVYIPLPPFILQDKNFNSDIIMGELGNTLQIDNKNPIIWK